MSAAKALLLPARAKPLANNRGRSLYPPSLTTSRNGR
jgi:hypothetical protein